MQNIPPLQQKQAADTRQPKRGKKAMATENIAADTQPVKRHLDRRHRQDRRHKQMNVSPERRQRGLLRRKSDSDSLLDAESDALSDTVGKHINTTA